MMVCPTQQFGACTHMSVDKMPLSKKPRLACTPSPFKCHDSAVCCPADPFLVLLLSGGFSSRLEQQTASRPPRTWTVALHHTYACHCRVLAPGHAAQLGAARAGLPGPSRCSACAPALQLCPARHSCGRGAPAGLGRGQVGPAPARRQGGRVLQRLQAGHCSPRHRLGLGKESLSRFQRGLSSHLQPQQQVRGVDFGLRPGQVQFVKREGFAVQQQLDAMLLNL